MSREITQLRELIQEMYEKFSYTADDEMIAATLKETIEVQAVVNELMAKLLKPCPTMENIIEDICLVKGCVAGSDGAYQYFINKYQPIIKKATEIRIIKLDLTDKIGDRVDEVVYHILQCLCYGKKAYEKCPPAYTLAKFDRKRSSLKTFINHIINPEKGIGIIATYMNWQGIPIANEDNKTIPFEEEYMEGKETLPPQTIEIYRMSEEEKKNVIDRLFEICKPKPEDLEIIKALLTMYRIWGKTYAEINSVMTNYVVNFIEKNGDKGMIVKNAKDHKFFSREEDKFHLCFILGFQLHFDGAGWIHIDEIFDRMFEEKDTLMSGDISKIISRIQDDLSKEGFNGNMVEDSGLETEYRLSTNPYLVNIDSANRYLRLWFFKEGCRGMTKENVRKKKKDAFDRLRKIGGEEFYELFRKD